MLPTKRAFRSPAPCPDNDDETSSAKDVKRIKDEVAEKPSCPEGTSEIQMLANAKDNVPAPVHFARRPRKENLTSFKSSDSHSNSGKACCTALPSAEADIDEEMWKFVSQTSLVTRKSKFYAAHRRHVAQEQAESCAVLSDAQTSEQWNQMLTALTSADETHENEQ